MTIHWKLHQLECLVAVVDHGGVRKAALSLGRSAAAVSKSMRELEQQVGTALTERHAQALAPTEAGATLLAHARLVLGQLQRAGEEMLQRGSKTGGEVRMAVTPWLLQSVLPATIREYRALRPDVQLYIAEHLGDEYPDVRSGALHFALGPPPDASQAGVLETRRLFRYTYAVVGRLGHPAAGVRRLADLKDYDWLVSRPVEHLSPVLREFFATVRRGKVQRLHVARSVQAALAIVRDTDMLTFVPWPLVETTEMRDRVTTLHLDGETLGESATCLVTRSFEPMPGAVIAFLDCLFRTTREHARSTDTGMRRIFSMVDVC
ncbi:hypothetical protein BKK81_25880 [Cupriavidus sp. USMAHM13]|uniref:LysR family transcriptional regulator n=1 Tax=Cupriavidus sp. USMAHM13 TaxID=1389192 RepID=UPI0008A6A231|nr:LysR substrate-binding domain-containing protein [Cupriavidus sp. USMAHM13]AOZ02640.1 hypothetical protein BKK81_25880 [Cupriavidus sp. USMAHM13]